MLMGLDQEDTAAEVLGQPQVSGRPQLTPEQFQQWKQRKDAEAAEAALAAARQRSEDIAAGRVAMNGRELFENEPWVFDDARFVDSHSSQGA
eukprot:jgi/Mesen1/5451/ME000273S04702